jgi:uncharacterized membrane protein YkvA (DUF1232 family)
MRGWMRLGRDFLAMLQDRSYRFPSYLKWLALVCVLYLISPVDVVPDVLLPFGVVDDIGLIIFVLKKLYDEVLKYGHDRSGE